MARRKGGNFALTASPASARKRFNPGKRGRPSTKAPKLPPQQVEEIRVLPEPSSNAFIPTNFKNAPYYTKKKRVLQYNRARWLNFPSIAAPRVKYLYPEEYNDWLVEEIQTVRDSKTRDTKIDFHDGWYRPQKIDREIRELKRAKEAQYSKRDRKIKVHGFGKKQTFEIDKRERGDPITVKSSKIPAFIDSVQLQLDANGSNAKIPPYIEFTEEEIDQILEFDREVKTNERLLLKYKQKLGTAKQTAIVTDKDGNKKFVTPMEAYEQKRLAEISKTTQMRTDVGLMESQMREFQQSVEQPARQVASIAGSVARNVAEGIIAGGVVASGGGSALAGKVAMGEVRPKSGILGTAKQAYQEEREAKVDKEIASVTRDIDKYVASINEKVANEELTKEEGEKQLEAARKQAKIRLDKLRYQTGGIEVTAATRLKRTPIKTMNLTPKSTLNPATKAKLDAAIAGLGETKEQKQEKEKQQKEKQQTKLKETTAKKYDDVETTLDQLPLQERESRISILAEKSVLPEEYERALKEIPAEIREEESEDAFRRASKIAEQYAILRLKPNEKGKAEYEIKQIRGAADRHANAIRIRKEKEAKQLKEEENAKKLKEIQRKGDEEAAAKKAKEESEKELEKVKQEQLEIAKGVGEEVEKKKGEKLRKEFEEFKRQNQLKEEREKAKKEVLGAE